MDGNLTYNPSSGTISATAFSGDGSNLTGIGTQGPDGAFRGITVAGISTFNDDIRVTAGGINAVGVITATSFSGSGSGLTDISIPGITTTTASSFHDLSLGGGLTVAGVSTFSSSVDINSVLDVDGQANLDEVVVAGAATFTNVITAARINITGVGLNVSNETDLSEVVVSGASTFSKAVDINAGLDVDGQTDLDELVVAGVSTFSAKAVFNTAYPSIDADNEIQVGTAIQIGRAGVITATSFSGSGANLTNLPASTDGSFIGLNVTGLSLSLIHI